MIFNISLWKLTIVISETKKQLKNIKKYQTAKLQIGGNIENLASDSNKILLFILNT